MQNYFAFGSNMARTTLDERSVRAGRVGAAYVAEHRLAFTLPSQRWTGHAADMLPDRNHRTWGVLWQLEDPHALDPYETRYDRVPITVTLSGEGSSRPTTAFTYTVKPELRAVWEDSPAPAYLDRMLVGAAEAGLPAAYVEFLEGFRR